MERIRTRTDLRSQIAHLRSENKRLQGALDEIADIVNEEESEDESGVGDEREDDSAEEVGRN